MIGLIISIIIFNFFAFRTSKRITRNQILHIWVFTIAFQTVFDVFVDIKYEGYWYFTKAVDWESLLNLILLIPPVNMMFLNWYPFKHSIFKQIGYLTLWEIGLLAYELVVLLPAPIGYFHYGWWNLGYSAVVNPILLLILLSYYRLVNRLEKEL